MKPEGKRTFEQVLSAFWMASVSSVWLSPMPPNCLVVTSQNGMSDVVSFDPAAAYQEIVRLVAEVVVHSSNSSEKQSIILLHRPGKVV